MWFTKITDFLAQSVFRLLLLKKNFLKKERKVSQFVMSFRKTQRKRNVRKIKWKTPKNSLGRESAWARNHQEVRRTRIPLRTIRLKQINWNKKKRGKQREKHQGKMKNKKRGVK